MDLAADTSYDPVMRGCGAFLSLPHLKPSCPDSRKDVVARKRKPPKAS
jgi:hypothetical protein